MMFNTIISTLFMATAIHAAPTLRRRAQADLVGIVLDGDASDWDESTDRWYPMFRAGHTSGDVAGRVFMRTNKASGTICIYAKSVSFIQESANENWFKDEAVSMSSMPPIGGQVWYVRDSTGKAIGFEACYKHDTKYMTVREQIQIHFNWSDNGQMNTGSTGRVLPKQKFAAPSKHAIIDLGVDYVPPPPVAPVIADTLPFHVWDASDSLGDLKDPSGTVVAKAYSKLLCAKAEVCVLVKSVNGKAVIPDESVALMKDCTGGSEGFTYEKSYFQFIAEGGAIIGWEACYKVNDDVLSVPEFANVQVKITTKCEGDIIASTSTDVIPSIDLNFCEQWQSVPEPDLAASNPVIPDSAQPVTELPPVSEWIREDGIPMYNQGNPSKDLVAFAYKMHKCDEGVLCILVEAMGDFVLNTKGGEDEAWFKDYTNRNNGEKYPTHSFAFLYKDGKAVGWEGCYKLPATMSSVTRKVEIHANYDDNAKGEIGNTVSTGKGKSNSGPLIDMQLNCPVIPSDPTPTDPTPLDPTPTDPTPSDPTPTDPTPSDPTPTDPTPSDPTPTDPTPSDPTPTDPTPSDPTPTDPTPSDPTPTDPTPSDPTPTDPTPSDPTSTDPESDDGLTSPDYPDCCESEDSTFTFGFGHSKGSPAPPVSTTPFNSWDKTEEFLGNMWNQGNPTKQVAAKAYLKVKCDEGAVCVLVEAVGDVVILTQKDNAWLKDYGIGGNNQYQELSFTFIQTGNKITGWEGCYKIPPSAVGTIRTAVEIHASYNLGSERGNTASTGKGGSNSGPLISMDLTCPAPEPEPAPQPNPAPEPEPAPQPNPAPEPEPAPQPNPAPEPEPEPQPNPDIDFGPGNTRGGDSPSGGGYGDPHFKTWHGRVYDFHGECDLVLTKSSSMASGKGVEVQVRTVIRRDWSFIAEAAIKIGDDVLEVGSHAVYFINGVEGESLMVGGEFHKNKDLYSIGGYPTKYYGYGTKRHKFEIDLGTTGKILIKIYNEFLAVSVEDANLADFADAVGLMGSHETGQLLGRNGQEIVDTKEFGFEWQVRDTDEMLFREAKGPQFPTLCRMPSPKAMKRRRLLETMVSYKEAEKACEGFEEEARESCIFDVLSTGDLSMADAGAM